MNYPLLDIFLSTMWFFLWVLWFMLLFRIFGDLFRDDSLSGWGKAGWSVFVIILPFLGVFIYLIVRGKSMGERQMTRMQQSDDDFRAYVRDAAQPSGTASAPKAGPAEQLSRLAELRERGDITQDEFDRAKALILA